ncbi:MAG: DNA double-strand break repair nuclease NurA [Chloroflexi bacterium]|nr:DNA double-strand break repair nuclease NurA [Chloroflexota bacterium]
MPLDLGETMLQLDRVGQNLGRSQQLREDRLRAFLDAASEVSAATAAEKTAFDPDRPFLAAQVTDTLLGKYAPAPPPQDWCVAAVDGSHIDVDRHLPLSCYLVNLGGCTLTYGSQPDASFFSHPEVSDDSGDLYLTDPNNPAQEAALTGPLLGLHRTVRELERLVQAVEDCPAELPILALVDGSLVLWGLSGRAYPPFVKEALVQDRLLVALSRMRDMAERRPLCLAAYVSLPRSTEVVNAARTCLCPFEVGRCRRSCSNRRSALSPCNLANELLDRDLFQRILEPGWRSAVYRTNSSVPRESYGDQQICFFYLHAGEEIARVEIPQWVANDEKLLALSHSLILDQCHRGQGYPVAISEAHEQAVITGADRQLFKQIVSNILDREGLPTSTSEKERSKRTPWV